MGDAGTVVVLAPLRKEVQRETAIRIYAIYKNIPIGI